MKKDNRKIDVASVMAEVENAPSLFEDSSKAPRALAAPKAISISQFPKLYREKIRGYLLSGASFLRLIRQTKIADGIVLVIGYVDMAIGIVSPEPEV